jgi:hypothetical protein
MFKDLINKASGFYGEELIAGRISKIQKRIGGYLINNFTFHDEGISVQIDHIYINDSGIFVIETKNYAGEIKGDANGYEWIQSLAGGRTNNKLKNPIKQNAGHIFHLKHLITYKNIPFYSVIVFTNKANKIHVKNVSESFVIKLKDLEYLLVSQKKLTCSDVTSLIFDKLVSADEHITKKDHIKEIKKRQKRILQNHICPRCGATLKLVKTKNGMFYGCENFPTCKFKMRYQENLTGWSVKKTLFVVLIPIIIILLILVIVILITSFI